MTRRLQSGAAGGGAAPQPFGAAPLAARCCHRGSPDGSPGCPAGSLARIRGSPASNPGLPRAAIGAASGDSGCPKNELRTYVLRQLGIGLTVPSRPVPYGIVIDLLGIYSECLYVIM